MRILLAIDGSKDAETATAFLKQLPLPPFTAADHGRRDVADLSA